MRVMVMNFERHSQVASLITELNHAFPLAREIRNTREHAQALEQVEDLLEDYETNYILIEALSASIERYESSADEFSVFNQRQTDIEPAIATLRFLMEQHNLNTTDFENEIGKKSLVSQILNGHKQLTRRHIENLAARFAISPALFF